MNTESHSEKDLVSTGRSEQDIRFRCPHCQKLYRTTSDVFEGSQAAEFDCMSCDKAFTLKTELDSFGMYVTQAPERTVFEACPKCSNLKPKKEDECPSCGVFVSKYIELQKNESPALYELNQMWQSVVSHFDQDQYHQDFLNKCHQSMALNFAFQKYAELQKTVGYDALCDRYIKQIELRLDQQFKSPQFNKDVTPPAVFESQFSGSQILFLSIGAVGMALLIYNKFVPTFPNFNGLVLSLTVLSFGVGLFTNSKSQTN